MTNYERMIALADEVFAYREDPDQLLVDEAVIERLQQLHPATLSEFADENGPVAWILLIPTTANLMDKFLKGELSEKQLFYETPLHQRYTALYLCSALVLPEYRRKGIAKKLTIEAINKMKKDHPIECLFVWPFTTEGDITAEKLAEAVHLPLKKREPQHLS